MECLQAPLRTPSSPDCSRLIPFALDCARLSPTGACSQATYTQAVPLAGSIFKMLPARGTRQRKFEFDGTPNQELNKIIRFKERSIQILLHLSQRRLQDVYSVYTTRHVQHVQC